MANTSLTTIFDKAWYQLRLPSFGFFNFRITQVFAAATFGVSLIDGISSFFAFLYTSFPPVVERLASGFVSVSDFITGLFTTSGETAYNSTEAIIDAIETSQVPADGSGTILDIVKYLFNVDAVADFLNFVVSIGWFWIFIVVSVLVVCTGLLFASCVIYVTRRFIVFISVGLVDYG